MVRLTSIKFPLLVSPHQQPLQATKILHEICRQGEHPHHFHHHRPHQSQATSHCLQNNGGLTLTELPSKPTSKWQTKNTISHHNGTYQIPRHKHILRTQNAAPQTQYGGNVVVKHIIHDDPNHIHSSSHQSINIYDTNTPPPPDFMPANFIAAVPLSATMTTTTKNHPSRLQMLLYNQQPSINNN